MKTILFLSLVLLLTSCVGSKSSKSSKGQEYNNQQQSQETKKKQTECLENALGWTRSPPQDKAQALKQLSQVNFERCATEEIMDIYIEGVMLLHPQLQF